MGHRLRDHPAPSTSSAITSALAGAVIGSGEKLAAVRDVRGMVGLINSPQSEYLFPPRAEDLRAPRAAAERKRPGRGPSSSIASADRARVLSRPVRAIRITRWPGGQMQGLWRAGYFPRKRRRLAADGRRGGCRGAFRGSSPSLGGVESLIEQPRRAELPRVHARAAAGHRAFPTT